MSITTKCRCGKSYLLQDHLAGKSFRCKQCSKTVTVPGGIDELEEIDDVDDADDELPSVRRRGKKRNSKEWDRTKATLWDVGRQLPGGFIRIIGMVVGSLAYVIGVACFLYAVLVLGHSLSSGNGIGPTFFFGFLGMMQFMGARAATGRGLMISREREWTGDGSILAGIWIIILGLAFPFIIIWIVHEFVAL